jgi:hypothetical protein
LSIYVVQLRRALRAAGASKARSIQRICWAKVALSCNSRPLVILCLIIYQTKSSYPLPPIVQGRHKFSSVIAGTVPIIMSRYSQIRNSGPIRTPSMTSTRPLKYWKKPYIDKCTNIYPRHISARPHVGHQTAIFFVLCLPPAEVGDSYREGLVTTSCGLSSAVLAGSCYSSQISLSTNYTKHPLN